MIDAGSDERPPPTGAWRARICPGWHCNGWLNSPKFVHIHTLGFYNSNRVYGNLTNPTIRHDSDSPNPMRMYVEVGHDSDHAP